MKITKSKLKEIISEEISNLTEFDQPEENAPSARVPGGAQTADAGRVSRGVDNVASLKQALARIDTVMEFEQLFGIILGKLDPQLLTDQEFKAAMRRIYSKVNQDKIKPGM